MTPNRNSDHLPSLVLLILLSILFHTLYAREQGTSIHRTREQLAVPIEVPANNPSYYKFVMPSGDEYLMVDMFSRIPFQFQLDYHTANNPDTSFSLANTLMFLKFSTMSMDLAGSGQTNVFNVTMRFGYGEDFIQSHNESSLSVAYWKEDHWAPFSGGYTLDPDINMMTIDANFFDLQNPVTTFVFYERLTDPSVPGEVEEPVNPPSTPTDQSTATVVQIGGGTNTTSTFSLKDETVNLQVGLFAPSKTFQYMIIDYGDSNPMPSLGLQMYKPIAFFDFLILTPVRPRFLVEFEARLASQQEGAQLEFVVYDYLEGRWRNFPTISDHSNSYSVIQRVQSGVGVNSIGVTSIALVTILNSSDTTVNLDKMNEFSTYSSRRVQEKMVAEIPDVNYELDVDIPVDSSRVLQTFAIKIDQGEWISVEIWDPSSDFSFKLVKLDDNPYPDESLPQAALYNVFRFDISSPNNAVPLYQAVFRYHYNEELLTFSASSLSFATRDESKWVRFLKGTIRNSNNGVVVQMTSSETDLPHMSNIIALVYGAPLDSDIEEDDILPLGTPVAIESEEGDSSSKFVFALSDFELLFVTIQNPSKNFELTITSRSENPIPDEPIPRPAELKFFDVSVSGTSGNNGNLPSFYAIFQYQYQDEALGRNDGDSITFVRLNNFTSWVLFEHVTLRNVDARIASQPVKTSIDLQEPVTTIGILAGRYGARLPGTPDEPPVTPVASTSPEHPTIPSDPDEGEVIMANFNELYTIPSGTEQIAYRFKLSTSRYFQISMKSVRSGEFTFQIKTRSTDPSPDSELPGLALAFFTIIVDDDIPSYDGALIYQYVAAELADPLLDEKTISIIPFNYEKGRWVLSQDTVVSMHQNIAYLPFSSQKLLRSGLNNFAVVVKDPSRPFAGLPETDTQSKATTHNTTLGWTLVIIIALVHSLF